MFKSKPQMSPEEILSAEQVDASAVLYKQKTTVFLRIAKHFEDEMMLLVEGEGYGYQIQQIHRVNDSYSLAEIQEAFDRIRVQVQVIAAEEIELESVFKRVELLPEKTAALFLRSVPILISVMKLVHLSDPRFKREVKNNIATFRRLHAMLERLEADLFTEEAKVKHSTSEIEQKAWKHLQYTLQVTRRNIENALQSIQRKKDLFGMK